MTPRTVLIVDDTEINRQLLNAALKSDYFILEAKNGREALELLSHHGNTVSAVLLDVYMPEMDGFEVLQIIRNNVSLQNLPVIIITSSTEESVRIRALTLGANDFVMKPYNTAILKHCLSNNIALNEAASAMSALQRDRLTGLYSREAFFETVEKLVSENEPGFYIMACFDINKFKVINDQYGTNKGDEVLLHIAQVFDEGFSPYGGICCRVAADDFAVLYPVSMCDTPEIKNLRQKAAEIEGLASPIAFSIGRYVITDTDMLPSAMYDRAMLAADSVKGNYDKHIAYYDESMHEQLIREQQMVMEMENALRERQFEVWLQPQYNHTNGSLIGAEALVRWRHPKKNLISPGTFVPLFEQNGFIYTLDKFVWEETCRYLRKWLNEGRNPLAVSVNISRYDLYRPDIVGCITGLIKKYDIPVDLLRLEITESAFMDSSAQIVTIVKQLIELGFTVEIDDFGSGYSSLNTLKDVPAQIIKLDMKFLESSELGRGGNIVESVVRMAKWLGMTVIAEGVETPEQASFLESIGCSYVQGYLYAHPMSAEEYEHFCENASKEIRLSALETVDNLNNDAFWDPNSMDTLIFNSFVGAACIFEYRRNTGDIELLRATDKYTQIVGNTGLSVEDMLKLKWADHLDERYKTTVMEALDKSASENTDVTNDYTFIDLPGCPHFTYLRSTLRVIASISDRYLVYCTNENITEQKQTEKKSEILAYQLNTIMENVDLGIVASIIEENQVKIIFSNSKYYSILGYTREQFEAEISDNYLTVAEPYRKLVFDETLRISRENGSISMSFDAVCRDGSIVKLNMTASTGYFADIDRPVQLSVFKDITAEVNAEQEKLHAAEQLNSIINTINNGITAAVFRNDLIKFVFSNHAFYELHGLSRSDSDISVQSLFSTIHPDDRELLINTIRQSYKTETPAQLEYRMQMPDGSEKWIKTYISTTHFSGIPETVQLCVFNDITTRKINERKLHSNALLINALMEDTPGGFCRLMLLPERKMKLLYANAGLSKLVDMTETQMRNIHKDNILARVHSADKSTVDAMITEMETTGNPCSVRFRFKKPDNKYTWLMLYGRAVKDIDGETVLNLYFADANQQVKNEEIQRILLDNLPFGAALFTYKDNHLSAVHLNRRYWELVGREAQDVANINVLNNVHPDDRGILLHEIQAGIRANRNLAVDIRVNIANNGDYRHFHVSANLTKEDDGSYSIYAVYTPLDSDLLSYQQLLPIVLSTIMHSTTDLTFAKDANFNYICSSRAFVNMAGISDENDIIGKSDYDIFPKEIADKYRRDDIKILESGIPMIDVTEPIPSPNDIPRFSSTSKYILRDATGGIAGLYGIGRDITEYRDAFDKLTLLTGTLPGGIATYEFTDENLSLIDFNDGYCSLFDMSREEYAAQAGKNPTCHVHADDLPILLEHIRLLLADKPAPPCNYRIITPKGVVKWVNHNATVAYREHNKLIVNAILQDISGQRSSVEELRQSRDELMLAIKLSGNVICTFDIDKKSMSMSPDVAKSFSMEETIYNIPEEPVSLGLISPETASVYRNFFNGIIGGKQSCSALFCQKYSGSWCWVQAKSATVYSADDTPIRAIISFSDVTEQLEKETVYKKWIQSFETRSSDSFMLFRCNLCKDESFDMVEGSLLYMDFNKCKPDFNSRANDYALSFIYEPDRDKYLAIINSDALIKNFRNGMRNALIEYREQMPDGDLRWLRLSVELVEFPGSTDIEAYLMYENITDEKLAEIQTKELSETDPLTGVLNRTTFASLVESTIRSMSLSTRHALLMLDIDGFKQINDVFGHAAGDQALIDTADALRSILRHNDILCRLGGDEFMVFLSDISDDLAVLQKAKQMCAVVRKSFSEDVHISGSVGVAISPFDGVDFDSLYKKADSALYHVKGTGKDNYAIYRSSMQDGHSEQDELVIPEPEIRSSKKRRMLIVGTTLPEYEIIASLFNEDFICERAKDGVTALIRLRHYGSAISVMIADMKTSNPDCFTLLEKVHQAHELQLIPIIIINSDVTPGDGLLAIKTGATDFVPSPFNPQLLLSRVNSAVSKAENERLRAKNSYLELRNEERLRYETALEGSGLAIIEYNWLRGTFIYSPSVEKYIGGRFDERKLWRILLSDMVADTATVQKMQGLVHRIAEDRSKISASINVELKTPFRTTHVFKMNVRKIIDEYKLTNKMIITLLDTQLD